MTLHAGEQIGTGRLRIMRTWPADPENEPHDPDAGDVLETAAGTRYLIHRAVPTRGHPPEARRVTLTCERLGEGDPFPAGAMVWTLQPRKRP